MGKDTPDKENQTKESAAPITEHLAELRKRLVICFAAVGIGFIVSYNFSSQLFTILTLPLFDVLPDKNSMIFTGLTEGFFTYLKISLIAGTMLAMPVIFYQVWAFISPGLYAHEKKYILPFTVLSVVFFAGGVLFGYFVIFPFAFRFFLSFNTENITALPAMKEYLSFSIKLLLSFGVAFELPIFIVFLNKLGLITLEMLTKNRKYVIIGVFVVSAILTPPDVLTQILMAIPLMLLYEIGIMGVRLFGKKRERPNNKEGTI